MSIKQDEKKILNMIKYLPILFIFILSILVTQIILYKKNEHFKNDIKMIESSYLKNNKNHIQEEIERIYNQIKIEKKEIDHLVTVNSENMIKERILKRIKNIRFGENGYIFVYNLDGTCLSHFKDKFIGINRLNVKDKAGKFIVKDLLDFTKKNKQGFISYIASIKPSDKIKSREKISYVKLVEDWNWVIGAGFYLDSLANQINNEKEKITKSNIESIKEIMYISIFLTILTLILSFYFSKYVEKRFLKYKIKIENQKETLLKAQEVAHIGDWRLDLNTSKAYWSNEMIRILGVDKKDNDTFGPEVLKSIMIDEDISCFTNSLDLCIKTGKEHLCMYRIKRADDEIRWIECRGILGKDKSFMMGTVQDITESKLLEIEKQQKDELLYQQSKMAAMGEMLGNIAHQWRQPLSTISTASTGAKLQKEMNCLSDEELNDSLTAINDSAQYLSTTIDDFRGFFNPANNKVIEFNILATINKTLKLVKAQFTAKDIEIIQNIENFELSSIENELIQVLINILNNARDILITKENQKRLIFINTYKKDAVSYIEITDNAGGVKEDIIDRIFEPYFTTKHKSQGTGIGLYMSEEIIRKHLNGNLLVSNENYSYEDIDYTGAKFTIEIKI